MLNRVRCILWIFGYFIKVLTMNYNFLIILKIINISVLHFGKKLKRHKKTLLTLERYFKNSCSKANKLFAIENIRRVFLNYIN